MRSVMKRGATSTSNTAGRTENYQRFPALIAELLAAKVEVIVTAGTPATLAVKRATTTVPLVMIAVGDPVGTGIVPSLARPGGNITGLSSISPELEGKRLELLREIIPNLSHVALFLNPANPFHVTSMKQARPAAEKLRIKLLVLEVKKTEDLEGAFSSILKERPEALLHPCRPCVPAQPTHAHGFRHQAPTTDHDFPTGNWSRPAA